MLHHLVRRQYTVGNVSSTSGMRTFKLVWVLRMGMRCQVATAMAVMTGAPYLEKQQFLDNFWADWKPLLGKGHVIQSLKKCDFSPIYEWHMAEREKRKGLAKEVRLAAAQLEALQHSQ